MPLGLRLPALKAPAGNGVVCKFTTGRIPGPSQPGGRLTRRVRQRLPGAATDDSDAIPVTRSRSQRRRTVTTAT
jgi:hypothetical protein